MDVACMCEKAHTKYNHRLSCHSLLWDVCNNVRISDAVDNDVRDKRLTILVKYITCTLNDFIKHIGWWVVFRGVPDLSMISDILGGELSDIRFLRGALNFPIHDHREWCTYNRLKNRLKMTPEAKYGGVVSMCSGIYISLCTSWSILSRWGYFHNIWKQSLAIIFCMLFSLLIHVMQITISYQ